ncbi:MAG: hypothetical protein QXN96_00915 [Candidatus Bathyarchaeia archaeon]
MKKCIVCGKEFEAKRITAKTCSDKCRKAYSRAKSNVTDNVTVRIEPVTLNPVTEVTDNVTEVTEPEVNLSMLDFLILKNQNEILTGIVADLVKRVERLESENEELRARVSKLEELIQDLQAGVAVSYGSRNSPSKGNGDNGYMFGKKKQASGIMPKKNPWVNT